MCPDTVLPELGQTLGDALLAVHRSYLKPIRALMAAGLLRGAAHITGGGITENLPRVLNASCRARIDLDAWKLPAIFQWLRINGGVEESEMLRTFNCGVGMIVCVAEEDEAAALEKLRESGERPFVLGKLIPGEPGVSYTGRL